MRLASMLLSTALTVLACGGTPVASTLGTAIPDDVQRTADGHWPATPEGVCAHLSECGCSPVPSFRACVLQQKMATGTIDGAMQLQDQIVDVGMEGADASEKQLVKGITGLGHGLIQGGMEATMAHMATAECQPLCAEIERAAAEAR